MFRATSNDLFVPGVAASVLGAGSVIGLALALTGPVDAASMSATAGPPTRVTAPAAPASADPGYGPTVPGPVVVASSAAPSVEGTAVVPRSRSTRRSPPTSAPGQAHPRAEPTAISPKVPEIRRTVMVARTAPPPVTVVVREEALRPPTAQPATGPVTDPVTWRRSVVGAGNARPSAASAP